MYAPEWARTRPGRFASPPKDARAYARYLGALIDRYGPRRQLLDRAPRAAGASAARLADLERAAPALAVGHRARRLAARLHGAAEARPPHRQGARPRRQGRARRPHERLLARAGAALRRRRRAAPSTSRPCTCTPASVKNAFTIVRLFRTVMRRHRDARTPVWMTEVSWPAARGKVDPGPGFRSVVTTDEGMAAPPARPLRTGAEGAPLAAPAARLLVLVGHLLRRPRATASTTPASAATATTSSPQSRRCAPSAAWRGASRLGDVSSFCRHNRFVSECPICAKGTVLDPTRTASRPRSTRAAQPQRVSPAPRRSRRGDRAPSPRRPYAAVGPYEGRELRLERVPGGLRLASWRGGQLERVAPLLAAEDLPRLLAQAVEKELLSAADVQAVRGGRARRRSRRAPRRSPPPASDAARAAPASCATSCAWRRSRTVSCASRAG